MEGDKTQVHIDHEGLRGRAEHEDGVQAIIGQPQDTGFTHGSDEKTPSLQGGLQSSSIAPNASVPSGQPVPHDGDDLGRVASGPAYSVLTKRNKTWITIMATFGSFVSPTTANIYFPALNPLSQDLHVSTSLINLTLTTYMIFQAISPTFFGDFGDMAGRRPAYVLAFTIYFFANVGLALQRNYAALLVLRCLQSAGSSGTLALGYAVVADIASTAERGRYMGIVGAGINVGPTLGPVIGGLLSQYLGWPAIFWFCGIYVFVWTIPFVLTVPETCRNVVGNGSICPQWWNITLINYLQRKETAHQAAAPKRKLRFPNPLRTLVVVFEKEMGLILFISSIIYLGFILTVATLSTQFQGIYHYDDLQVGLCYLPYGFGCFMSVIFQGYVLDWNYRRIAKKLGVVISRKRGDDLRQFPIETARIQPVYPMLVLGAGSVIGYGWSLEAKTSVAAPLVMVFMVGAFVTSSFSILNTLIVDLNPDAPATATAANNLVRCLLGSVATAVVQKMIDAMGVGWCFTFFALLIAMCLPGLRVLEIKGIQWRAERAKREAKRQARRSSSQM